MPFAHFPGDRFSGTWKKTIVAYEWRGRQCIRTYVVPHNPRTAAHRPTSDGSRTPYGHGDHWTWLNGGGSMRAHGG